MGSVPMKHFQGGTSKAILNFSIILPADTNSVEESSIGNFFPAYHWPDSFSRAVLRWSLPYTQYFFPLLLGPAMNPIYSCSPFSPCFTRISVNRPYVWVSVLKLVP